MHNQPIKITHHLELSTAQFDTLTESLYCHSRVLLPLFVKVRDNEKMTDEEFSSYPLPSWVDDFDAVRAYEESFLSIVSPLSEVKQCSL